MTFELLPSITPWIVGFFALAIIGTAVAVVAVATTLAEARRTRVARHESVRSYDGRLVLGH